MPRNLRFGVVSCANLQAGWFSRLPRPGQRATTCTPCSTSATTSTSTAPASTAYGQDNTDIRRHEPAHEMVSLADYRQRHAQYKRDPDLQDAHAKFPWIVTWDDHEVTNDQWRNGAENHNAGRGRLHARAAPAPTARTTSGCRSGWTAPPGSATATGCSGGCGSAGWPS